MTFHRKGGSSPLGPTPKSAHDIDQWPVNHLIVTMNEIYFRGNSHGTLPKKLDTFPILKGLNARIPFVANSKISVRSSPSDKEGWAVIQTLR